MQQQEIELTDYLLGEVINHKSNDYMQTFYFTHKLVAIEVVLNQYQVNVPKWFDALLIVCAIGSILVAGYNGQKTA